MSEITKILEKFGIEATNIDNYNILIACLREIIQFYKEKKLKIIQDWDVPLLSNLKELDDDEINQLEKEIYNNEIPIEECQIEVQRSLSQNDRKKLAVYYTTNEGVNLMVLLIDEHIKNF